MGFFARRGPLSLHCSLSLLAPAASYLIPSDHRHSCVDGDGGDRSGARGETLQKTHFSWSTAYNYEEQRDEG